MLNQLNAPANGYLAFELNVLSRRKFDSVMLPFTVQPTLGAYLKQRGTRVAANDVSRAAWTRNVAAIQNNREILSAADVDLILEDAYTPRYRLMNPALRRFFGETEAWWFDNVRQNIERLTSPIARAVALSLGMNVAEYAASFDEETRELRQPFSAIYRRLQQIAPAPFDNGQINECSRQSAESFVTDSKNLADLMFLRLPSAISGIQPDQTERDEIWLDNGENSPTRNGNAENLGAAVQTKSQYIQLLDDFLRLAKDVPAWAVAHVEDGFLTTQEIVEIVGRTRRVDTIYSKDFSELTGTKAVFITA